LGDHIDIQLDAQKPPSINSIAESELKKAPPELYDINTGSEIILPVPFVESADVSSELQVVSLDVQGEGEQKLLPSLASVPSFNTTEETEGNLSDLENLPKVEKIVEDDSDMADNIFPSSKRGLPISEDSEDGQYSYAKDPEKSGETLAMTENALSPTDTNIQYKESLGVKMSECMEETSSDGFSDTGEIISSDKACKKFNEQLTDSEILHYQDSSIQANIISQPSEIDTAEETIYNQVKLSFFI
jgi:hypothetical protein